MPPPPNSHLNKGGRQVPGSPAFAFIVTDMNQASGRGCPRDAPLSVSSRPSSAEGDGPASMLWLHRAGKAHACPAEGRSPGHRPMALLLYSEHLLPSDPKTPVTPTLPRDPPAAQGPSRCPGTPTLIAHVTVLVCGEWGPWPETLIVVCTHSHRPDTLLPGGQDGSEQDDRGRGTGAGTRDGRRGWGTGTGDGQRMGGTGGRGQGVRSALGRAPPMPCRRGARSPRASLLHQKPLPCLQSRKCSCGGAGVSTWHPRGPQLRTIKPEGQEAQDPSRVSLPSHSHACAALRLCFPLLFSPYLLPGAGLSVM